MLATYQFVCRDFCEWRALVILEDWAGQNLGRGLHFPWRPLRIRGQVATEGVGQLCIEEGPLEVWVTGGT